MTLFGIGTGALFSPLANLATSGLDGRTAGAGAGAFNTTRQIGGVIGSAAIVAMLTSRLAVTIPAAAEAAADQVPEQFRQSFVDGFASGKLRRRRRPRSCRPRCRPTSPRRSGRSRSRRCTPGSPPRSTQTMLLTVVVLVLGLVSSLAMKGGRPVHAAPEKVAARSDRRDEGPGGRPGAFVVGSGAAAAASCTARPARCPAAPR